MFKYQRRLICGINYEYDRSRDATNDEKYINLGCDETEIAKFYSLKDMLRKYENTSKGYVKNMR